VHIRSAEVEESATSGLLAFRAVEDFQEIVWETVGNGYGEALTTPQRHFRGI